VRQKEAQPRPFSGRRSRRSVRSGYAFAHSEGFGRLITSGRIMREVGGLGGGRSKGANGQVSGRNVSTSNGAVGKGGGRPSRSPSELTVPPGRVEDF